MDRSQFLTNFNSLSFFHGFLDYVKVNITEKETTATMNERGSFIQLLFVLLFQIGFRLLGETFDFFTKVFLFILVDVLMVLIVVYEWFNSEAGWKIWVKEVCGEPKK